MCKSNLASNQIITGINDQYYVARLTNLEPIDSLFWQLGDDVIPPCKICRDARHSISESINDSCPIHSHISNL